MNRWFKQIICLLLISDIFSANPTRTSAVLQREKKALFKDRFAGGKQNFQDQTIQQTLNTQYSTRQLENDQLILKENGECRCSCGSHIQDKVENENQGYFKPTNPYLIRGKIQPNIISNEDESSSSESMLNPQREVRRKLALPISPFSEPLSTDVKDYKRCTGTLSEGILKAESKDIESRNSALGNTFSLENSNVSCCSALRKVIFNMLNLQEECPCSKIMRIPHQNIINMSNNKDDRFLKGKTRQNLLPILGKQPGVRISDVTNKVKQSHSNLSREENTIPFRNNDTVGLNLKPIDNQNKVLTLKPKFFEDNNPEKDQKQLWTTTLNGNNDIPRNDSIISQITDGENKSFVKDRAYGNETQLTTEKNQGDILIAMSGSTSDHKSIPDRYSKDMKNDSIIETIPKELVGDSGTYNGIPIDFNDNRKIEPEDGNIIHSATETDDKRMEEHSVVFSTPVTIYNKSYTKDNEANILSSLSKSQETNNEISKAELYDDINTLGNSSDMSKESTTEYLLIIDDKKPTDLVTYSLTKDDKTASNEDVFQEQSKPKPWLTKNQDPQYKAGEIGSNNNRLDEPTEENIKVLESLPNGSENKKDSSTPHDLLIKNESSSSNPPESKSEENSMVQLNSVEKKIIDALEQQPVSRHRVDSITAIKPSDQLLTAVMTGTSIESNGTNNVDQFRSKEVNDTQGENSPSGTNYQPSKLQHEKINVDGISTLIDAISMESQTQASVIQKGKSYNNFNQKNSNGISASDPPVYPTNLEPNLNNVQQPDKPQDGIFNILGSNKNVPDQINIDENNETKRLPNNSILDKTTSVSGQDFDNHQQPNKQQNNLVNISESNKNASYPIETSMDETGTSPNDSLLNNKSTVLGQNSNNEQKNKPQNELFNILGSSKNVSDPIKKSIDGSGRLTNNSLLDKTTSVSGQDFDNHQQPNKQQNNLVNISESNKNASYPIETSINETGTSRNDSLLNNKSTVLRQNNNNEQKNKPQNGLFNILGSSKNVSDPIKTSIDGSGRLTNNSLVDSPSIVLRQDYNNHQQPNKPQDSLLNIIGSNKNVLDPIEKRIHESGTLPNNSLLDRTPGFPEQDFDNQQPNKPQDSLLNIIGSNINVSHSIETSVDKSGKLSSESLPDNKPIVSEQNNNNEQKNKPQNVLFNIPGSNKNVSDPIEKRIEGPETLPNISLLDITPNVSEQDFDNPQPQDSLLNFLGSNKNVTDSIETRADENGKLSSESSLGNRPIIVSGQNNNKEQKNNPQNVSNKNVSAPIEKRIDGSGTLPNNSLLDRKPNFSEQDFDNHQQPNKPHDSLLNILGSNINVSEPIETSVDKSGKLSSASLLHNKLIAPEQNNNNEQKKNPQNGLFNIPGSNKNVSDPIEKRIEGLGTLSNISLLDITPNVSEQDFDNLQPQDSLLNFLGSNKNVTDSIETRADETGKLSSESLLDNRPIIVSGQNNNKEQKNNPQNVSNKNVSDPIEKRIDGSGTLPNNSLLDRNPNVSEQDFDNHQQPNKPQDSLLNILGSNINVSDPIETSVDKPGKLPSESLLHNKPIVPEQNNNNEQKNNPQNGLFNIPGSNKNETKLGETETLPRVSLIDNKPIVSQMNSNINSPLNNPQDGILRMLGPNKNLSDPSKAIINETGTPPSDSLLDNIPIVLGQDLYHNLQPNKPQDSLANLLPRNNITSSNLLQTNMDNMNQTFDQNKAAPVSDLEMDRADDILRNVINSFKNQLSLNITPNHFSTTENTVTDIPPFYATEANGNVGNDEGEYTESYTRAFKQGKYPFNIGFNSTSHDLDSLQKQMVLNNITDPSNTGTTMKDNISELYSSTATYNVPKLKDEVDETLAHVHEKVKLSTEINFFMSPAESESSSVTLPPNYQEQQSTSLVKFFTTDPDHQSPTVHITYRPESTTNLLGLTENFNNEPNQPNFNSFLGEAKINSNNNNRNTGKQDPLKPSTNFPSFSEPSRETFNSITDLEEEILSTGDYLVHDSKHQNVTDINQPTTQISPISNIEPNNNDIPQEYGESTLNKDNRDKEPTAIFDKNEEKDVIHDYLFSKVSHPNFTSESENSLSMKTPEEISSTENDIDVDRHDYTRMTTTTESSKTGFVESTTQSSVLLCLPEQFSEDHNSKNNFPAGRFFVQNDMNIIELELVRKNVSQCSSLNNLYEFKPKSPVSSTEMNFIKSLEGQHISQIFKRTHQNLNTTAYEMTSEKQPQIRGEMNAYGNRKFGMERSKTYSFQPESSQDLRKSEIVQNKHFNETPNPQMIGSHGLPNDTQMKKPRTKNEPGRFIKNVRSKFNKGRTRIALESGNPLKIDKDILKRFISVYKPLTYFNGL